MTDNEIRKALECCRNGWCNECPYKSPTSYGCVEKSTDDVLDLINRLKAEREDYKSLYENSKEEHLELIKAIKHTKSEARKEFAEELIHKIANTPTTFPSTYFPYRDGIKYREAEIIAMIKELAGDKK